MAKDYNVILRRICERQIPKAFAEAYEASKGWVPSAGAVLHAANHPRRTPEEAHRDWIQKRSMQQLALPEPIPTNEQLAENIRILYRSAGIERQLGSVTAFVLIWAIILIAMFSTFASIARCK